MALEEPGTAYRAPRWKAPFIGIAVLIPALLWIALNRAPFTGDESQYARSSLELLRALVRDPLGWPHQLITISPYKPSGLIWLGQFFAVPGYLFQTHDKALLFCTWVVQALTLALLGSALYRLTEGRLLPSALAVLVCGSAPLFVLAGGYFMVEPLQTLVAAWFIYIMAHASRDPGAVTLARLAAASAAAALSKQTTVLFVLWPGLVAFGYALRNARADRCWGWQERSARVALVWAGFLAMAAAAWYTRNWQASMAYVISNTRGPIAAVWGKENTFLGALDHWFGILPGTVALPHWAILMLLLIGSGIAFMLVRRRHSTPHDFTVAGVACLLQAATVLLVFSLSSNQQSRFLLPILPALGLLVCWSVSVIGSRALTALVCSMFVIQLTLVWLQAFGLQHVGSGVVLRQLDRDGRDARLMTAIVAKTCERVNGQPSRNIIAIDPGFRGDWLAPEPANYMATRNIRLRDDPSCVYDYLGGGFLGERAETAWDDLLSRPVRYVVTIDPGVHPVPAITYNRALDSIHFPVFWGNLERGNVFKRDARLAEDTGIVVFVR